MNRLCNPAKQRNKQKVTKLVIDGKEVIKDIDVANGLNNYFCNVGDNLVKLLPQAKVSYNDYTKGGVRDSMFCEPVTVLELTNLIVSLNTNKSCGPDNISLQFVKDNCAILFEPLVYL